MTVKKAIEILDWWINHKKQSVEQLVKKWNYADYDRCTEVYHALIESEKIILSNLETILAELVPDCKHPKKMRDRLSDGQWYCMNCNMDL